MTTTQLIEIVKKHGAIGVLCAWLVWTNVRLGAVEQKLYLCYDRILTAEITTAKLNQIKPNKFYAVLPEPIKISRKKHG
jgi:hypothetical protein